MLKEQDVNVNDTIKGRMDSPEYKYDSGSYGQSHIYIQGNENFRGKNHVFVLYLRICYKK